MKFLQLLILTTLVLCGQSAVGMSKSEVVKKQLLNFHDVVERIKSQNKTLLVCTEVNDGTVTWYRHFQDEAKQIKKDLEDIDDYSLLTAAQLQTFCADLTFYRQFLEIWKNEAFYKDEKRLYRDVCDKDHYAWILDGLHGLHGSNASLSLQSIDTLFTKKLKDKTKITVRDASFKLGEFSFTTKAYSATASAATPAPVSTPVPAAAPKAPQAQPDKLNLKAIKLTPVTLVNWSTKYTIGVYSPLSDVTGKWVYLAPKTRKELININPAALQLRACTSAQCGLGQGDFAWKDMSPTNTLTCADMSMAINTGKRTVLLFDAGIQFFSDVSKYPEMTHLYGDFLKEAQKYTVSKTIRVLPISSFKEPAATIFTKCPIK